MNKGMKRSLRIRKMMEAFVFVGIIQRFKLTVRGTKMKTTIRVFLLLAVTAQLSRSQWSLQNSPVSSRLFDINFSGEKGVVVGDSIIMTSSDSGKTWAVQKFPRAWILTQCRFQAKDSIWVAGFTTSHRNILLRSVDGGVNWSVVDSSFNGLSGTSICFLDKQHGWIGGSGSGLGADTNGWISRTMDGGQTWKRTDSSFAYINDVFFSDSLHGWACSDYGNIIKTTDGGNTWIFNYLALFNGVGEPIRHIMFTSLNRGWASGGMNEQTILRTTNSGQSWENKTTLSNIDAVRGMCFADSSNGWLVGGWGGTSRIAHTSDGGTTWSLQADGIAVSIATHDFYGVYMFNSRLGFIVGGGGIILKTTNGGVTVAVQEKKSKPIQFQLFANYPNPFNPSTTIQFSVPLRSRVHLIIFNILGQQVAELANEEMGVGSYERIWNANVASGLYFYRLEAVSVSDPGKRFVDVKKMVLLK